MAKVLKYVRARMDLLNYIADHGFAPGDKLPREKDLVEVFNMSSISLRRAMNDLAEQGVIEKVQGLGTFLRRTVNQLDKQGTIVLLDIQDHKPFTVPTMARDLQIILEKRRMAFQFLPALEPSGHIDRLLGEATGVLVVGRVTPEWATFLETLVMPLIVLGSNPFAERFHTVTYDWQSAARLVMENFIGRGMRRIGLINGEIDYFPAQRLYDGYRESLAAHDIAFDKNRVIWPENTHIYEAVKKLLNEQELDAVLVEKGATSAVMNWCWNYQPRAMPIMGVAEYFSSHSLIAGRGNRIVKVEYQNDLLEEAVRAFYTLLAGNDQHIHIMLKPTIADPKFASA